MLCVKREVYLCGFRAVEISSPALAVTVVPELGGKIVSLYDRSARREWCWRPDEKIRLFANRLGDSFDESPLTGIDECFPTIESCRVKDRELPCHGELWSAQWTVSAEGDISIACRTSPFSLQRRLTLEGNRLSLHYALENLGHEPENFVWAFHPLLRVSERDQLQLPDEVSTLTIESALGSPADEAGGTWMWPRPFPGFTLDRFELGENLQGRFKGFTGRLSEGRATLANTFSGESLTLTWNVEANPYLGVWMTRGGYRGHHHIVALEPTNAPTDSLARVPLDHTRRILPGEKRQWEVHLQTGSASPASNS